MDVCSTKSGMVLSYFFSKIWQLSYFVVSGYIKLYVYIFRKPNIGTISDVNRIVEWSRLEETFKIKSNYQPGLPSFITKSCPFVPDSTCLLNTSRHDNSTPSLGSPFQCLTITSAKQFLLNIHPTLSWPKLRQPISCKTYLDWKSNWCATKQGALKNSLFLFVYCEILLAVFKN